MLLNSLEVKLLRLSLDDDEDRLSISLLKGLFTYSKNCPHLTSPSCKPFQLC